MAKAIRTKFSTDFAIATSGYSGPTGGTPSNPIGTVFIAISSKDKIVSKRFRFEGSRESVVIQAVVSGIEFLLQEIKNQQ